ncbi:MAG TPA: hypothetical protein VMS74_03220 [Acidimicrobiia bacterium]|nr:hypothetical protein [Acidimicrobiia bacterium]
MDTTSPHEDPIEQVAQLLAAVVASDPADSVEPLTRIAAILEQMLDEGDDF